MPAASNTAAMLVEHAITVETAGMAVEPGVQQHLARDVAPGQVGITTPQTIRSGRPASASIAFTAGTEIPRAS